MSTVVEELSDRLRKEIAERQKDPAFRKALRSTILEHGRTGTPPLPAQRKVQEDKSRLLTLCCSRRAGKSEVCSRLIADELVEAGFNEWICFGAGTLSIAKDIVWDELTALNEKYALGWDINNSDLSIRTPRGGRFRLFGVNDKKSVDKVRGKKYRLVICDEASTYEPHLKELVERAFDPGTKDLKGRIILAGTPGYVKAGYWYEASQGKLKGWSNHHWTIFDNVHIPDVEQALRETREMFGWDEDHPTYRGEYLGIWVDNSSLLVCDFEENRNTVGEEELETLGYNLSWRHVIGIDFGSVDATAWTVVAVDPTTDKRYCVYSFAQSGLVGDEPVEITRDLVEHYRTTYAVCDPGGGGKFFLTTFNAKWAKTTGCTIRSADKIDLLGSIRLLNSELRTGRLRFLSPDTASAFGDIRRLLWKDERRDKIVEGKAFPQDLFDSLRYSLRETIAWKASGKPEDAGLPPALLAEKKARDARIARQQKKATRPWYER
jgi:hypothetical protein